MIWQEVTRMAEVVLVVRGYTERHGSSEGDIELVVSPRHFWIGDEGVVIYGVALEDIAEIRGGDRLVLQRTNGTLDELPARARRSAEHAKIAARLGELIRERRVASGGYR